jgi:TonB-linked SusC/RagA family outer membrane protein
MKRNSKYKFLKSLNLRTTFVLLSLVFVQSITNIGFSQTKTANDVKKAKITGQVIDEKNETVIGATVMLNGTRIAVTTDVNGRFSIEAPENGKLKFSYIGYESQLVSIEGKKTIDVTLIPSLKALDEVVVTAFGTQKKVNVTGAIGTVEGKELLAIPASNISNMLVGSATGISGLTTSGEPGRNGTNIWIRGQGTYNSSTPLIVIDGIEQPSEQAFAELNSMDANEIDGISILKDAASTAVYGIRGANGVIIVTTKRGTKGKPTIEFTANYGITQATNIQQNVNSFEYATARNAGINILKNQVGNTSDNAYLFSQDQLWKFQNNRDYTPAEVAAMTNLTDAQKAQLNASPALYYTSRDLDKMMFSGNGPQTQMNVKVSGGSDFVKYSTSVGYFNQKGIGPDVTFMGFNTASTYDRFNFRSNFDFNVSKNTQIVLNLAGQFSTSVGPGANSPQYGIVDPGNMNTRYQVMTQLVVEGSPLALPTFMDGHLISGIAGAAGSASNPMGLQNVQIGNPVTATLVNGNGWLNNTLLDNSIRINHKMDYLISGLTLHATASYKSNYQKYVLLKPALPQYTFRRNLTDPNQIDYYGGNYGANTFNLAPGYNTNWSQTYFEAGVNYDKTFGDHKVTGLLLGKASQYNGSGIAYNTPSGIMGLVARAMYSFKDRYLFELNMGYNGTEQFAKGQRFGLFPAYSVGWVPTNESFFKENKWVTFLKIRASYGEIGNDQYASRRYLYLPSTYSLGYNTIANLQGYSLGNGNGSTNDPFYKGGAEGALGNPAVTWERAQKLDIGLESRFLSDRLSLTADYFHDTRNNILTSSGIIPVVFGAGSVPPINIGSTDNGGYEITVGWNDKIDQVGYFANLGISYAKNKITFQAEAPNAYDWMNRTGHPMGQYYGLLNDGFFNTPADLANRTYNTYTSNAAVLGDIKYKDVNGDGKIDNKDMVPIGYSNLPQYHYNFKLGVNYKGFELSALFIGSQNGSYYLNTGITIPFQKTAGNMWQWNYDDMWTPEKVAAGTPIGAPRIDMVATSSTASYLTSDFWLRSTDFVKLKNLQLSYTFKNSKILKSVGISSLRIYTNADNIFTFKNALSKYGIDPESVDANTAYIYPLTQVINFGLSVKF